MRASTTIKIEYDEELGDGIYLSFRDDLGICDVTIEEEDWPEVKILANKLGWEQDNVQD